MKEFIQANNFYTGLTAEQREDLLGAIAESTLFLERSLQEEVIGLLQRVNKGLAAEIERRNSFTR